MAYLTEGVQQNWFETTEIIRGILEKRGIAGSKATLTRVGQLKSLALKCWVHCDVYILTKLIDRFASI